MNDLERALPLPQNDGYRTVALNFTTDGSSNYTVFVDGEHSQFSTQALFLSSLPAYDACTADGNAMAYIGSTRDSGWRRSH